MSVLQGGCRAAECQPDIARTIRETQIYRDFVIIRLKVYVGTARDKNVPRLIHPWMKQKVRYKCYGKFELTYLVVSE